MRKPSSGTSGGRLWLCRKRRQSVKARNAALSANAPRVIVSSPTTSPNGQWVAQQARNATMTMGDLGLGVSHLLIDHDTKFTAAFDAVFEAEVRW